MSHWIQSLRLAETSAGQEMVEEVSGLIETAGNRADNFLSGLPVLTTRLAMAALIIFIGCIFIRIGP